MNRRNFILNGLSLSMLSAITWPIAAHASEKTTRYLLIRDTSDNSCLPDSMKSKKVRRTINGKKQWVTRHGVIKGKLYGVPDFIKMENADKHTTDLMEYLCDTQELTYLDNQKNISSIPVAIYPACVRTDNSKSWMRSEFRRWRIQLENVENNRTFIQFHYGKDFSWSDGCIILTGKSSSNSCLGNKENSPESAVKAVKDYYDKTQNRSHPPTTGKVCKAVSVQVKII